MALLAELWPAAGSLGSRRERTQILTLPTPSSQPGPASLKTPIRVNPQSSLLFRKDVCEPLTWTSKKFLFSVLFFFFKVDHFWSLLNLLHCCFCFMFCFFDQEACGILAS